MNCRIENRKGRGVRYNNSGRWLKKMLNFVLNSESLLALRKGASSHIAGADIYLFILDLKSYIFFKDRKEHSRFPCYYVPP